jgi:hypothetical protein
VCPMAGLDDCGKSRLPPGFDPGTFQPVASRYTDCATTNHEPATECSFVCESILSFGSVCVGGGGGGGGGG